MVPRPESPTIVLVPGSFSPSHFYHATAAALKSHGIETHIVDTPSVGRRDPLPPASMSDDAEAVTAVVRNLVEGQGKYVVLVAHSYGGIPATESLKSGTLTTYARDTVGKAGGVIKLVYMTAVVPWIGQSCITFMGQLPDFLDVKDDYITQDPVPNAKLTFSDLPPDEALQWAKQMPEQATPSFNEELSYAGYRDVEVAYVVCEHDMIIPPAYQEGMIQFLTEDTGKVVDVYRLESGHCPNASQPENLAEVLRSVALKAVKG